MLEIRVGDKGEIHLAGRFDASQAVKAETFMAALTESRVIDLGNLEYISSLGLGVLLATQKRLMASGHALKLVNENAPYALGFSTVGAGLGLLVAALALLAALTGFCTGCEAYKLACLLRRRPFVSCPIPGARA